MDNEELKNYLIDNFKEILPAGKYKFEPDFYIKRIIPVIMENKFSNLKKTIEEDNKMLECFNYENKLSQEEIKKELRENKLTHECSERERLKITELREYHSKLEYASKIFNQNPFNPEIEELLIKLDEQLTTLDGFFEKN